MKTRLLVALTFMLLFAQKTFSMYAYIYSTNDVCSSSNGTATVYVNGGLPPYTFQWSNGAVDQTVTGLAGGTFLSVWAYDSASDSAYTSVYIQSQSGLYPSAMSWAGSYPCENLCNGEARMIFDQLGGTPPYTATYDGVPMDPITFPFVGVKISNVCWNATGEVNVVDANGCSVTWYEPPYYSVVPVITGATVTGACNGNNGSVTMIDNSDFNFGMFNYNLYDSAMNVIVYGIYSNSISGLAAGTYYAELVTNSGHYDQYTFQWIIDPCYSVIYQFTIPDLGPFCSNVSGNVFHDDNLNCSPDNGELKLPNVMLTFTPGPYSALTDQQGNYALNLPAGTYNIVQNAPYAVNQICPPVSQTITIYNGGPIINYDFADTALSTLDLMSFISATTTRPGFNFTYYITGTDLSFFNGGQSTITFNYDPSLQFISADPVPTSQSAGQITWDINSITLSAPFNADVILYVPSAMPLGTSLNASANISTVLSENNLLNNTDQITSTVVGSFDPNEKNVRAIGEYPGPQITASESLDYTIQFQNTGADTAFNVVIYDTLSPLLNLNSVFVTHATHECNIDGLNDHVLKFSFPNILLPDSGTNEPASHGYVDFRVSQQPGNLPGEVISNRAAIVFDFNSPVMTNDAVVNICEFDTIVSSVSICEGDSIYAGGAWQHEAGTYLDHYSNIYTCDSSVTTELNLISINDSIVVVDAVLTAFQSNESYQWFDCNLSQPIPGATDQSFTAAQNGSYAVQITTSEGCSKQSNCVDIVGMGETSFQQNNLFSFYPNPVADRLVIHSAKSFLSRKIFIRNSLNQIVMERIFSEQENRADEIDVSNLPYGVYFISMLTNEGNASTCFVKQTP